MPGNWTPAALKRQQPQQQPQQQAQPQRNYITPLPQQPQQPVRPAQPVRSANSMQAQHRQPAQAPVQQPIRPAQAPVQQPGQAQAPQPVHPAWPAQSPAQQSLQAPPAPQPFRTVPTTQAQQQPQQAPSSQSEGESVDNKIDNIFGNGVVMDFKPMFTPPDKSYASVYGKPSVITVTITRFGQQGQQTVTVRHNIAPYIVEAIEGVSQKFAFVKPSTVGDSVISTQGVSQLNNALNAVYAAINALNQGQPAYTLNDASAQLGMAISSIKPAGNTPDFYFQEVKVNSWKIGKDGYAPVSTIEIQRCGMRNGEPARYPWIFTIENFEAVAKKSQKGTVTYDSKTKRSQPGKEKGLVIMASDKDVYNMANRSRHFIEAWIMKTTTAALRAAERKEQK